ncbi:hypothetical protein D3C80_2154500 [compost metagenome]
MIAVLVVVASVRGVCATRMGPINDAHRHRNPFEISVLFIYSSYLNALFNI